MNILNQILLKMPVFSAGFNDGAARSLVNSYLEPMTKFFLWLVPGVGVFSALVTAVIYMLKDEEEKDRHKYHKTLKKILAVCVVAECILSIFAIVGITTG